MKRRVMAQLEPSALNCDGLQSRQSDFPLNTSLSRNQKFLPTLYNMQCSNFSCGITVSRVNKGVQGKNLPGQAWRKKPLENSPEIGNAMQKSVRKHRFLMSLPIGKGITWNAIIYLHPGIASTSVSLILPRSFFFFSVCYITLFSYSVKPGTHALQPSYLLFPQADV